MNKSNKNKPFSEEELKFKHSEKFKQLEEEIAEQKKVLMNYKKDHGKLEVFFERLEQVLKPFTPEPIVYKPNLETKSKSSSAAVMHSTDQHEGAVQLPDEIEGFGQFNPLVCRRRKVGFAYDFLKWIKFQSGFNLPELHIIDTGDNVSGDIHQELQITNEHPVTVQCVNAAINSALQVQVLAPHFDRVIYHFIGSDNHGRLMKKPQAKEEGINSYNFLVGYILGLMIRKHDNVDFRLYPQYQKVINVLNRNYLITHSHGVKGWAGIPWYGLQRKVGKEAQARLQKIMKEIQDNVIKMSRQVGFHLMIHGHFHTPYFAPTLLLYGGGSISGTDAYDHKEGRYSDPSQTGWIVHPENMEQCNQPFWLSRHDDNNIFDSTFGIQLDY